MSVCGLPDLSSMAKTPSTQASTARAEAQSSSESPREKAAEAVVLPMAPPVIHPKNDPPELDRRWCAFPFPEASEAPDVFSASAKASADALSPAARPAFAAAA